MVHTEDSSFNEIPLQVSSPDYLPNPEDLPPPIRIDDIIFRTPLSESDDSDEIQDQEGEAGTNPPMETDSMASPGAIQGNGEVFYVDKIMKKRNRHGRVEYLVKWLNYPHKMNTWEPENSFYYKDAIVEFENSVAEKKKQRSKRRQEKLFTRSLHRSSSRPELSTEPEILENNPNEQCVGTTISSTGAIQPIYPEISQFEIDNMISSMKTEVASDSEFEMRQFVDTCEALALDLTDTREKMCKRTASETEYDIFENTVIPTKMTKLDLAPFDDDNEEMHFAESISRLQAFVGALLEDNESEDEGDFCANVFNLMPLF